MHEDTHLILFGKSEEHCASDSEKGPRFTWDKQKDGQYINERLGPFILYFDSEKRKNIANEHYLLGIVILVSVLIPIVNVIGIPSPLLNILSSILGSIAVALTSILQLKKHHERWHLSKTTAAKLKKEYYHWKNKVGEYSCSNKNEVISPPNKNEEEYKLAILVNNCEAILLSEATEFVDMFRITEGATIARTQSNQANK